MNSVLELIIYVVTVVILYRVGLSLGHIYMLLFIDG